MAKFSRQAIIIALAIKMQFGDDARAAWRYLSEAWRAAYAPDKPRKPRGRPRSKRLDRAAAELRKGASLYTVARKYIGAKKFSRLSPPERKKKVDGFIWTLKRSGRWKTSKLNRPQK